MTVASEISRLQTDKECMRQAIIDKGVDVAASVSFDDYAACIAAIPTGPKASQIDALLVGGGGGTIKEGGWYSSQMGGGGGGGGVKELMGIGIIGQAFNVTIGAGGTTGGRNADKRGGTTCFGDYEVSGGGGAAGVQEYTNSADGGGAGQGCRTDNYNTYKGIGKYNGGNRGTDSNGGGGGAGGIGGNGVSYKCGGAGGIGVPSCISGEVQYYGGGGGGASTYGSGSGGCGGCGGCGGGGNGGVCPGYGSDATYYGGGGGGGGGNGCQGIVIVRYPTDGSYGINCATGGCKYTCGDYTIHCFTSNDVFTIVS